MRLFWMIRKLIYRYGSPQVVQQLGLSGKPVAFEIGAGAIKET